MTKSESTRARTTRTQPKKASRARVASWIRPVSSVQIITIAFTVLFLILALSIPLRTFAQQRAELAESRDNIARLEAEVADLEQRKELYSDPAYVEEQARIRLGLVKEGETPFRILDPALSGSVMEQPEEEKRQLQGNWHQLLWQSISEVPKQEPPVPNPGHERATNPDNLPVVPTQE